jgi:hypothetical protein
MPRLLPAPTSRWRRRFVVGLAACLLGLGVWLLWPRSASDPDLYTVVCEPQPCAAELAIQDRLRRHIGGNVVHFVNYPARTPPDAAPSIRYYKGGSQPNVDVYRPLFTPDFQRAFVFIVRGDEWHYTIHQLKLVQRNGLWELDGYGDMHTEVFR